MPISNMHEHHEENDQDKMNKVLISEVPTTLACEIYCKLEEGLDDDALPFSVLRMSAIMCEKILCTA